MARKTKAPAQPTIEDERLLESVVDADAEATTLRGRRIRFRDLNQWALHKISRIMTEENADELALGCKCLAAARLNGYFKIRLFWGILWRWYAFIRQYTDAELTPAISLIKKKAAIALGVYSLNTTLLIGMKETIMRMNRAEAKVTLQELSGVSHGKSAKTDPT